MYIFNILLTFRNFRRFKSSLVINLIGLSSGLACTLLIYLWVNDELNFDKFHENKARIFQVMEHRETEGSITTTGQTQDFLADVLAEEMPEVELATVVTPPNFFPSFTLSEEGINIKGNGKFVGQDFLNIFSYPLIYGNPNTVFANKDDIVISESLAKRLFKNIDDCIGKSLEWQIMNIKRKVTVSGIFKDVPLNSSDQFDFLLTFDVFKDLIGIQNAEKNWSATAPFFTYVLMHKNTNPDHFNSKIADLIKTKSKNDQHRTLFLKRYTDNYLYGNYKDGIETGGRIEYVNLFSIIAIFILLIACINFMNLSTAEASWRMKETGINKAFGAQRKTLFFQYMGEAMFLIIISLIIALVLVELVLPKFNEITAKHLVLRFDLKFIIACAIITILTTQMAGSYPAIYLSGMSPINLLKGQFKTKSGEAWGRKGLVIFQFTIAIIFIVSVLVVFKQIEFVENKSLGYNKENIIYFETDGKLIENAETFITDLKNIPGVLNASGMLGSIISDEYGGGMNGKVMLNGKEVEIKYVAVNYGMLELLDIEVKQGRTFSKTFITDKDKVIYNEAAIKVLGLEDPVGKTVDGKEILGVVKDFHYQSFREIIKPLCIRLEPNSATNIIIKIRKGAEKQTITEVQKLYQSYNPGFVFSYKFLDQDYQAQYVNEKKVAFLALNFTILAIIISCLGLFGLVSFTIERKNKEIAIRKVSGSNEMKIIFLLSRQFTKMVIISVFIGLPVSYFIVSHWLKNFAYSIDLKWWYFLSSGVVVMLCAWVTLFFKILKASRVNPTLSLRSE